MKLLRDFFRSRIADRSMTVGRNASRRRWTITVPQPLVKSAPFADIDMPGNADPARGRSVGHEHETTASQARGHLQLLSSH